VEGVGFVDPSERDVADKRQTKTFHMGELGSVVEWGIGCPGGGSISNFPYSIRAKITHDASPFLIKISLHWPKCVASLISVYFNTLLRLRT